MQIAERKNTIDKESVLKSIAVSKSSSFAKYTSFFIGQDGLPAFLKYELAALLASPMPGAAGLLLRKILFGRIVSRAGAGVAWGRNVALRHPGRISIGDRTGVDDNCLIDARGAGEEGIVIGDDVLIARDSIVQAKTGPIRLGNRVTIGSQTQFSSVSGIFVGDTSMIGGQCYIGGGRYWIDDLDTPIRDQGLYSNGPVVIEEDVWIGAGVTILDGVRVGKGSVIGSGAVIREDIPPYTVVAPYQKLVKLPRGEKE